MSRLKTFIRKMYYTYLVDNIYSLRYYFKDLWGDLIDLLSELKNPKTWSAFLIITLIYAVVTRNYYLFKWLIPLIILVGMIRHKKARNYKKELLENALLKNNLIILEEAYSKYKRDCFFAKKCELGFEDWKADELEKVQMNNK